MAQLHGQKPPPRENPGGRTTEAKTKHPRNERFLLRFHPAKWCLLDGSVLPWLKNLAIVPGLSLTDKRGNIDQMVLSQEKRGWTVIPESWGPDGETYLRTVAGEQGTVWITQWMRCYAGSTRVDRHDEKGYADWLRQLIADGRLPAIEEHVLEGMIESVRSTYEAHDNQSQAIPSHRPLAEQALALLQRLEAERGDSPRQTLAATKPAPRKRRARASASE